MASIWDWLFGRGDTPRQTNNSSRAQSQPRSTSQSASPRPAQNNTFSTATLPRGGGGGSMFSMSAPAASGSRYSDPEFLAEAQRQHQEWLKTEQGQEWQRTVPQNIQPHEIGQAVEPPPEETGFFADLGRGHLRMAEEQAKVLPNAAEAVDDWFYRKIQDASTPINAEPLSVTSDRITKQRQADSSEDRLFGGFDGNVNTLTNEEFLALTPRQQAAVDFNTVLYHAVQADLADTEGTPDDNYREQVNWLFGEDGGSERYAPRTVELLAALGLQNTEAGDLDNFLDLNAGITSDQLDLLADSNFVEAVRGDVRQLNTLQIDASLQPVLAETLRSGQTLLDAFKTQMPDLYGDPGEILGQNYAAQGTRDYYLDLLFNAVMDPSADEAKIAEWVGDMERDWEVTPDQTAEYIQRRLEGLEQEYGLGRANAVTGVPDIATIRSRFIQRAE